MLAYYGYGYGYSYSYSPEYTLVMLGIMLAVLLSVFASFKVKSTYNKFAKIRSRSGITGEEAARRLLNSQGIYDVTIERVSGNLTDHYDPRKKVLRLSDSVYGSTSIAAVGVAAHECGHAVQHNKGYAPLNIRSAIVPVANFGSQLAWPMIILGLILGGSTLLIELGILMFSLAVLFQIITLPVEFNASSRALSLLDQNGILYQEEIPQARKVLSAAALTYVASAAVAILQLLRLIVMFGGRRRD